LAVNFKIKQKIDSIKGKEKSTIPVVLDLGVQKLQLSSDALKISKKLLEKFFSCTYIPLKAQTRPSTKFEVPMRWLYECR